MGVAVTVPKVRVDHLNVNEVFGPTIQGEGPNAGQLTTFLRLAGCNLSCSWCDTPYSWDWERYDRDAETHRMSIEDLAQELRSRSARRVVVSGGEPLLQAHGLYQLLMATQGDGLRFDLETNGTRPLGPTRWLWDTIITSPKVGPSAGQWDPRTGTPPQLDPEILSDADAFKFVVKDGDDLRAVHHWTHAQHVEPHRVWLMPEGTDAETLQGRTRWLADRAVEFGFNFTTRLHVLAWGDERAR